MSRYRLIRAEQASHPVTLLCRVGAVARSASYAWARRGVAARAQADATLAAQIAAALRAAGVRCARKRVARLMRAAGPVGCQRRRVRTTVADPAATLPPGGTPPAPNLVERDFAAPAPDRLWLGGITYLPTGGGWPSLAVLLDAHARRVVGWAMADHLRTELALDALAMAIHARRPPPGLIYHTDRGCQYTAAACQAALARNGLVCSMSRSGDCLDHAMAESFFATLKAEVADARPWPTRAAVRTAIFEWVEVFYNRQRGHSALAYRPPAVFEEVLLLSSPVA